MAIAINGYVQPVTNVDPSGNAPVYQTGSWINRVKTVPTPGTAVQCDALVAPVGLGIVVKAKSDNTELVYVGPSKLDAEDPTKRTSLAAGQAIILYVSNANLVWVDAVVALEGVETVVEQA